VPSRRPFETHKAAIGIACQAFIDQVLKPRFLAEVRPTEFNIDNPWAVARPHRFIQRYRSGFVDNPAGNSMRPSPASKYIAGNRFHLSYLRHTGQWHCLYWEVSLSQALSLIETDGLLHPH